MHTGSASNGLPNKEAKSSIKRLLTSISETASKTFNNKELYDVLKNSSFKCKLSHQIKKMQPTCFSRDSSRWGRYSAMHLWKKKKKTNEHNDMSTHILI